MRWRIRLLGGLSAEQPPVSITRFRTQKIAALLGFLAYRCGRSQPREELLELFWPDSAPPFARNSLSAALSSLRHQLEPPGVAPGTVIVATRATVELNPEAVATDVAEFASALEAARKAAGSAERTRSLEVAVALYRGALLEGYLHDWLLGERDRLRAEVLGALHDLAAASLASGDAGRARTLAARALAIESLDERASRDLMLACEALGDPGEALRHFRRMEQVFAREAGGPVSAASRDLARAIERRAAAGPAKQSSPAFPPIAPAPSPRRAEPVAGNALPTRRTLTLLVAGGVVPLPAQGSTPQGAAPEGGVRTLAENPRILAFDSPGDALAHALAVHRGSVPADRRPAMALDTGSVETRGTEHRGEVLEHARVLLSAAHPGQVICSEATAVLFRRDPEAGPLLEELGVYRLPGAPCAERLFHLRLSDTVEALPPPRLEPERWEGRLPLEQGPFFGREAEVERVEREILSGARLVTITGAGGMGKTRLALRVARRLLPQFRGAVFFADLSEVSDHRLLSGAALDAMGRARSSHEAPESQLDRALRGVRTLLVLDNFEQLLPGGASWIKERCDLLEGLTCLTTSREGLSLPGEREERLLPLPLPSGAETPEEILSLASTALFVERAQAARPDFQVTENNRAALVELVRRLEGIPLALALAARRTQVLALPDILARLSKRFDILSSGERGIAPRHRALRATIDWSYRLLPPDLQRFFAELSVFRGGFTLDAAEAVTEDALALDHLSMLIECSLLSSLAAADGSIRFHMLETLREYAGEALAGGSAPAVERRHAAHFIALAEESEDGIQGEDGRAWLERLQGDHDNLRAAMTWTLAQDDGGEAALRLAGALVYFYSVRGHFAEGCRALEQALERWKRPTVARGKALAGLALLYMRQSRTSLVRPRLEEALAIFRAECDAEGIGRVLNLLGLFEHGRGDLDSAVARYEEGIAIERNRGSTVALATILGNFALLLDRRGSASLALALLEESLETHRSKKNRVGVAQTLARLGSVAAERGDTKRGIALLRECLETQRALRDATGEAMALQFLGFAHETAGELSLARTCYEQALSLVEKLDAPGHVAEALGCLGRLAVHERATPLARSLLERGLAHSADAAPFARSVIERWLARVFLIEGDVATSRLILEDSLSSQKRGLRHSAVAWVEDFAALSLAEGDAARAARRLGAAAHVRELMQRPVPAVDRADHEALVACVRDALGERAFEALSTLDIRPGWEETLRAALFGA